MTGRNQNDDDNYRNSDVNNKNNPAEEKDLKSNDNKEISQGHSTVKIRYHKI